jgi:hypothetical protein
MCGVENTFLGTSTSSVSELFDVRERSHRALCVQFLCTAIADLSWNRSPKFQQPMNPARVSAESQGCKWGGLLRHVVIAAGGRSTSDASTQVLKSLARR